MKKILFATSNPDKLKETKAILTNVEIESIDVSIDEIQSLDAIEVVTKKARAYYDQIRQPLFVDDTSLNFNALNRLPGTYINDFFKEIGNEGLIELLNNKKDRTAISQVNIAYIDEHELLHIFIGETRGSIAVVPRGTNGFGWDPIFIPEGLDKTNAELSIQEKERVSSRQKALNKLAEFLKYS